MLSIDERTNKPRILVLLFAIITILALGSPGARAQSGLYIGSGNYTDPTYLTDVPFGEHSYWYQAWRAYNETMPANQFLNGVGMNMDTDIPAGSQSAACEMLAKYGVKNGRIEIDWSDFDYSTPGLNDFAFLFTPVLQACKTWGIRPLILLNANNGAPCPNVQVSGITATATASVGATTIHLSSTSGIVVGYTGIDGSGNNWMAQYLITALSGNTATLSQPLQYAISSGSTVSLHTLQYRPFSVPGSANYNATAAGWQAYVGYVSAYVQSILGTTTNTTDKGFDLECWNELTFGSNYLYINAYYNNNYNLNPVSGEGTPYVYDDTTIWTNLAQLTATVVDNTPSNYVGVSLTDGISNTIPWTASSQLDPAYTGLSKHPYPSQHTYPADDQDGPSGIDATGAEDASIYIPTYTENSPEYYGTLTQTESVCRDFSPITDAIAGVNHGRYARGATSPVWGWMTEMGMQPGGSFGVTNTTTALNMKAKYDMRSLCFYLNKGAKKEYLFAEDGLNDGEGDLGFSTLQANYVTYLGSNTTYPSPDTSYVSPALRCIGNIVNQFSSGVDNTLTFPTSRSITIGAVTQNGTTHSQFIGNGTTQYPTLFDQECLAILPYQINSSKFILPYYVMTRNVAQNFTFTPENFTFTLNGVNGIGATVTAYDPYNNTSVPITTSGATTTSITVTSNASDYPYLLTINENLLPDPNFALTPLNANGWGYNSWTGTDSFLWNSSVYYTGCTHSAEVTGTNMVAAYDTAGDALVQVAPSTNYTFGTWVKTTSFTGTGVCAVISLFDSSGTFIENLATSELLGTNGWTKLSSTVTLPSNATQADFYIYAQGSGTAYLDDCWLQKSP